MIEEQSDSALQSSVFFFFGQQNKINSRNNWRERENQPLYKFAEVGFGGKSFSYIFQWREREG